MRPWKFVVFVGIACILVLLACSEDEPTSPINGDDPGELCNVGKCIDNETRKNECIDNYTTCMDLPDADKDNCLTIGRQVCN